MKTRAAQRILITAALPYANGDLHLGHLAGAYLPADIYARFQRLRGRDVLFLCGSDEHGVAITVTAEKENVSPKEIVDRYHSRNEEAFQRFGMSFDNYSRTSLPLHHRVAQEFFAEFYKRKLLKPKSEKQLYCEKDGMFLADRYVEGTCPNCGFAQARGDQCESCGSWLNQTQLKDPRCKICGTAPVLRETTHLYFPLGEFQDRLVAYVAERDKRDGWKENVLRYCEGWFRQGLEDRAVTRDVSWGVPVPVKGYENKVIYVWFDAVLGYISSGQEWAARTGDADSWKRYWQDPATKYVAFIGKDNIVFHCIVFPAMLMAWNDARGEQFVLPENVPANEFLNFEGQKFSKSRGWGIDVRDFLKFFPADALRYALAVNLPEYRDSDFYVKDFQARTNNELADILGNFVNRTLSFTEKNFGSKVPKPAALSAADEEMLRKLKDAPAAVADHFEHYRFREGLQEVMSLARAGNKYFNDSEPWKSVKQDPARCAATLYVSVQTIRTLAVLVAPVTPALSEAVFGSLELGGGKDARSWDQAGEALIEPGHALRKSDVLVKKITDDEVEAMMNSLSGTPDQTATLAASAKPQISIEDFKKLDLRLGKITEASPVPKSEKLVRLRVDLGTETRQLVAGIAKHYRAEDLVGRRVVVVANLQPAKLMGVESQGMILAANSDDGRLALVTVDDELQVGSIVR